MDPSSAPNPNNGQPSPDDSLRSKIEFMKVAVLSPSQRHAVQLYLPKDWKLDPQSTTQPAAWISPDRSSVAIVFCIQKGGKENLMNSSLLGLQQAGAQILESARSEDSVGLAPRSSLKIHAKTPKMEIYEQGGVISLPECDFQVKVIHAAPGRPVSAEARKLVDTIWEKIDAS